MQHAPDLDRKPFVELDSTSSCTFASTCAVACTAPRERLNCGAATRREVDDDPRPVAEADEHLDLCRQPRRAHVKSFLRRAAGGRETRFSPANQHFDPGPISRKIRRCACWFVESHVALPAVTIGRRTVVDQCHSWYLGFQERLHAKNLPKTIYCIAQPELHCLPARRDVLRIAHRKLNPAETTGRERKGRTPCVAR